MYFATPSTATRTASAPQPLAEEINDREALLVNVDARCITGHIDCVSVCLKERRLVTRCIDEKESYRTRIVSLDMSCHRFGKVGCDQLAA
jgi:hypothetical protein